MKVLIADDEPMARSLLRTLLSDAGDIEVIGEAGDGGEAVALSESLHPDAVFLDIDMPGSGISAAHALQSRAEVVFVTAHEVHAVDAFELGAADYVLKPLRRLRLAKALDRVRARVRERCAADNGRRNRRRTDQVDQAFWVRARRGMVRVQISDIDRIEAARDHVYFHTAAGSYLHRVTMDELEERLADTGLVRVQRSAFVRLGKVVAIRRRGKSVQLELQDAARISVGPRYQSRILDALAGCGLDQRP